MNTNQTAVQDGAPRERRDPAGPATAVGPAEDEAPIPELERMKGVGDTLNGRFVLEECIGFGGMGMVYKALDLRKLEASDRKPYIAIKVLNVQFRGHPKSLIALQREARKAQALAHPNIVAVYDFDRDGSMVYLTMEYLVGQPLSRILRAPAFGGLPPDEAMPIISGMAKALAYAHQRGFVHCDLKPANVFLTERGDVKVIDFGIARVFQTTEEDMDATVFDAGSLGGLTPAYASPEMLEHGVPDPRDDIYALACITVELLTGHHPFDRVSASQARALGMKPVRPRYLSHRQWRALRNALQFDREARTASVETFLEDISDTRRPMVQAALAGAAVVVVVLVLAIGIGRYRSNHLPIPEEDGVADRASRDIGAPMDALGRGQCGSSRSVPFERPPMPPAPQIALPGAPSGPQYGAPPGSQQASPSTSPPVSPPTLPPALPQISRATLTTMLASMPCSALSASVRDHAVEVTGFLSRTAGIDRLKTRVAQIPGVASTTLDVQLVGEQACGALGLFGPYWLKSRQSGATVRTRTSGGQMTEGEPLILDVTTPNYDTWVNVDYFVLDGGVTHLLPSLRARDNQAPPSYSATIGSFGNWIISKPFGSELIVLVTTPAPLFNGLRPEYESASAYLRDTKKQLRHIAEKYGSDKIAVDLVQINTGPKR